MTTAKILDQWLYFGCWKQAGHHLYTQDGHHLYTQDGHHLYTQDGRWASWRQYDGLLKLDGLLAPIDTTPYVAAVSYLGRWRCTALSWWDPTVDDRPGSNSTIFAPRVLPARAVLREGRERFPYVFNRLPQDLVLDDGCN